MTSCPGGEGLDLFDAMDELVLEMLLLRRQRIQQVDCTSTKAKIRYTKEPYHNGRHGPHHSKFCPECSVGLFKLNLVEREKMSNLKTTYLLA